MKHVSLTMAIAVMTLLFSCKKNDDNSGNNGSGNQSGIAAMRKQIVGNWSVESKTMFTTGANGNVTTVDELEACEKDDTYSFTDNFYTFDNGAIKCPTSGNNNNRALQWTLYNDSTFEFAYGPGFNTSPRVDFVNATTLQLSARFAGSTDKEVFVYKRK